LEESHKIMLARAVDTATIINEMFSEQTPFNKILRLTVESTNYERVKVSFQMRDKLLGDC
jgi:hypothetical protein